MWKDLPENEKEEYKRMILAFASLTELFSQKNEENDEIPAPIINSKYQETIFQKAFHASAEDIGNTSYMKFNNKEIVLDTWDVKYAEDAYGLFSDIADKIYGIKKDTNVGRDNIRESYAWKIEVHRYSGFNGFFGVGSKMGTDAREGKINKVESKHQESVDEKLLSETSC